MTVPSKQINLETQEKTIFARKQGMIWVQRLKRVFNIDIEVSDICGKKVKVIACIKDPAVIKKILTHLKVACLLIKMDDMWVKGVEDVFCLT